jgi:hypothetical protein
MNRLAFGTVTVLLLWSATPAAAKVFVLSSGGRLEGELVNPDEKPRETYVIKLDKGGQITLKADQVEQVLEASAEQTEYDKVRPQYPDTVDGQWKLAEWCRERRLTALRETHLKRVVSLDPDHMEARRALGYYKIDGQWVTMEQWKTKQGYRLYKGKWLLPQQIELQEARRKKDLAEKEWFEKIKRWYGALGRDKEAKQARQNIANIDDPMAVKALAMRMMVKHEPRAENRLLFVEPLGKIKTPEADMTLAIAAVDDPDEEVRLSCLDYLKESGNKQVVDYFIGRLRDKDNDTINRAAVALSRMNDSKAVGPLIQALRTTHKKTLDPGSNPGSMSFGFSPQGGMGMGMGTRGPKVAVFTLNNPSVLDALVTLTKQNFSFDQRAWQTWHANQKKVEAVDARRG